MYERYLDNAPIGYCHSAYLRKYGLSNGITSPSTTPGYGSKHSGLNLASSTNKEWSYTIIVLE